MYVLKNMTPQTMLLLLLLQISLCTCVTNQTIRIKRHRSYNEILLNTEYYYYANEAMCYHFIGSGS